MGGLSLTKRFFNARFSACSIEDRAVRTRVSCSERWLCNVQTCARADSTTCRVRSMESTTFCTRCKTEGGVSGSFADWSVACQVLFNRSTRANCSSRLVACRVSSRANTDKRTSSGASCRQRFLHRFHLSGSREYGRCRPRWTDPPTRSPRSLGEKQVRTALPKVLLLVRRVWAPESVSPVSQKLAGLVPRRRWKPKPG
jgi:hypothetical protein